MAATPSPARSTASERASEMIPAFDALYCALSGSEVTPLIDAIRTIRPPSPCTRIWRAAAAAHSADPRRLTVSVRSQSSAVTSATSAFSQMAAAVTSASMRPNSATARSTTSWQ